MAVTSDVTISQDGEQENVKVHPYLVALVRWCVSCVWSTASLLVHRLLFSPLPITGSTGSKTLPKRAATHDHLHPDPLVECVVLHQPQLHNIDVIFVHGLYGSLVNTWRQGEWRTKYKTPPFKKTLVRPNSLLKPCKHNLKSTLKTFDYQSIDQYQNDINNMIDQYNIDNTDAILKNIEDNFYNEMKMIPEDDIFATDKFYTNSLYDTVEVVDNYERQAEFVQDLFRNESCDTKCDKTALNNSKVFPNDCICEGDCEVGCGCVCDACYSPCWPRDWIKEDYPDARVISINYTSDPYLWRPLWKKECKRLQLHERAEQMTSQLLELGVGERPIVWVGHSKGGLFIKQIYCEAYEAYKKMNATDSICKNNNSTKESNDCECNININSFNNFLDIENGNQFNESDRRPSNEFLNLECNNLNIENENEERDCNDRGREEMQSDEEGEDDSSKNGDEHPIPLRLRAGLWSNSAGFMFYSVPHRGSALADIKTPITTRSIELLEICKDNSVVLSLHERWSRAADGRVVSSLVETCRTLMSVLWLQIVDVNSADAGIGPLCGVNVDHREICKPTSRNCILYAELMNVMHAALDRCRCQ